MNASKTVESDEPRLPLVWNGPFSFQASEDVYRLQDSEYKDSGGVYLWTYRFGQEYRVNYVGKTKHFQKRFKQEVAFSRYGKWKQGTYTADAIIDYDQFFRDGIRVVVNDNPTEEDLKRALPDIERTLNVCRVFVSELGPEHQSWVEYFLTRHLWQNFSDILHFSNRLGIPTVLRGRPPASAPRSLVIENTVKSGANIRGVVGRICCIP